MKSLKELIIEGLEVIPDRRDTLITLQSMNASISFWKLMNGEIELEYIQLNRLNLYFEKHDSIANYDFLFQKRTELVVTENKKIHYSDQVSNLVNLFYGFMPENGKLIDLHITERKDSNFVTIHIPAFIIKENQFHTEATIVEDSSIQHWLSSGELNRNTNTLKAVIHAQENRRITLPYIIRRFGAEVSFDSLTYSFRKENGKNNPIQLKGEMRISGLQLFHKALSPEKIVLSSGKINYLINIGKDYIEVDSTTAIQFNKLQFSPYLKAEKKTKEWHFTASVNKSWFPADDLFTSLPTGLFSNLDGIRAKGEFAYHLLFDLDFAQIDSLQLESELSSKNFGITSYGTTNLGKMSDEFTYTAYENGQPVRSFAIGPSWKHFTPLDSISPILQMTVMQSEDGAFYHHRGFLIDAMREALIHDLKVKRFARGGSTITMQLVKNVFLNRNKNMARKLEEAFIVWLIETSGLTSKARMYEVYLNIIEWGPLIYGAQEAATYYFDKRPSQLNVQECIFLASIIPKPKQFRKSFTDEMNLKEDMEGYYHILTERLVKNGIITEAEADSIHPNIQVTGEASKDFSLSKDSMQNVLKKRMVE